MKCPKCKVMAEHRVIKSVKMESLIVRERICMNCGKKFQTYEKIYQDLDIQIRKGEDREPVQATS